MKITISNPTRLGIQAFTAASLAAIITNFFHFERSYWAIMTTVLLITQTWGETLKKSHERLLMTAIGGLFGTGLYYLSLQLPSLQFVMILIAIFFAVFFYDRSFLLTTFFATIFVVFFFAELQQWTIHLLSVRIFETCIGAVIAAATTTFVLPVKIGSTIREKLPMMVEKAQSITLHSLDALRTSSNNSRLLSFHHQKLFEQLIVLQDEGKAIHYEIFFRGHKRQKIKFMMVKLKALYHYLSCLNEAIKAVKVNEAMASISDELRQLSQALQNNYHVIIVMLNDDNTDLIFENIQPLREKLQNGILQSIESGKFSQSCWYYFYSCLYFITKINEVLAEIYDMLQHFPKRMGC